MRVLSNWNENSPFFHLINQSVDRHTQELWLLKSETFPTPPPPDLHNHDPEVATSDKETEGYDEKCN